MLITFYRSALCPRCALVRKYLVESLGDQYNKKVLEIDVLIHPLQTWKEKIRMIPALKCGDDILSGLMLSRESIASFLTRNRIHERT
jgi:hypothetical protein